MEIFLLDNIAKTDVLIFSYIGFSDQEIKVGSQTQLTVTLAESAEALDEGCGNWPWNSKTN